jgi:hypothetical protein
MFVTRHSVLPAVLAALVIGGQCVVPGGLVAQSKKAAITGRVTASGGSVPVPGARVSVVNLHRSTATDSTGRFAFPSLHPGHYLVEVTIIGFSPLSAIVELAENEQKDVEFRTDTTGVLLPTIFVEGESRPELVRPVTVFERRMASGHGRFITREAILDRNPMRIMDMIRFLPGVRSNCSGPYCQLRLNNDPTGCPPAVFVDDQRTSVAVLDATQPGDIEGVEVYRGPSETPPELNNETARCGGAIAVWTRRGLSR